MFTAKISWNMLGKDYEGETYSLIYKVKKDKIVNKEAKEWLEQGHELEASVRMQYVKIETAFNSDDTNYSKQKETYQTYYQQIANKDDFEEIYDRIKERYNEIIAELGLDISLEEDFKEIKEEIMNIDINTLTPVEALMKLNEIKRMLVKK